MGGLQACGVSWNLTDKRRVDVLEMLKKQWTLGGIAIHYGISVKTISKQLKKHKINYKEVKMSGISMVRARLYDDLTMIDDHKDRAVVAMKYLDKYDKEEEVAVVPVSDDDVVAKIMLELNV